MANSARQTQYQQHTHSHTHTDPGSLALPAVRRSWQSAAAVPGGVWLSPPLAFLAAHKREEEVVTAAVATAIRGAMGGGESTGQGCFIHDSLGDQGQRDATEICKTVRDPNSTPPTQLRGPRIPCVAEYPTLGIQYTQGRGGGREVTICVLYSSCQGEDRLARASLTTTITTWYHHLPLCSPPLSQTGRDQCL
ncbi:hypothetical protein O3P69_015204 [Scylla paramamosain]|uniref:Uncharacterized protein n=1 Tax=Scylla paramamosain TaxID=85552 RepID=A0AAW0T341_SCYPA